jgi:hypothetical protein
MIDKEYTDIIRKHFFRQYGNFEVRQLSEEAVNRLFFYSNKMPIFVLERVERKLVVNMTLWAFIRDNFGLTANEARDFIRGILKDYFSLEYISPMYGQAMYGQAMYGQAMNLSEYDKINFPSNQVSFRIPYVEEH